MSVSNRVYLAFCEEYNPLKIKELILQGMDALDVNLNGRITIKPNVVIAHPKSSAHVFTRSEFLDGLISAIDERGSIKGSVKIVERSGVTISTKAQFRRAGYNKLRKKHKISIKLEALEKTKVIKVPLKRGVLHKEITVAESLVKTDNLIYTPKFKFNILVNGITGALKLNIGILDDEERMQFHDMRLDQKIVDLYEVGKPTFIAVDGIIAGHGGSQLTSKQFDLGLILMGTNSLTVDVVSNWIINHDPKKIGHLIEAHKRGYGPIELDEIEILGKDLGFFQERTKDFDKGYVPVNEFSTNISILVGDGVVDEGSETQHQAYCMGGCHGILLDELLMSKDRDPVKPMKFKKDVKLVIGHYKGNVISNVLILIGDCTKVEGEVTVKKLIRVKGCPPNHKELMVALALEAGLYTDLYRLSLILPEWKFVIPHFLKRIHKPTAWKSIPEVLRHW